MSPLDLQIVNVGAWPPLRPCDSIRILDLTVFPKYDHIISRAGTACERMIDPMLAQCERQSRCQCLAMGVIPI